MALLIACVENSAMLKRGPYRKAGSRAAPPRWRRTFLMQWRNLRGMTQETLAEKSDVSVGLISSIEAGTSGYSAESLFKLAKALKIESGMILSVNPEENEPLWSVISRADANQMEQIAGHARVILEEKHQKDDK